jgi:DNA-binding PadR family transcriptional regulator
MKKQPLNLLNQWEETYKKGLLTFWMLLSLTERSMYAYEMKEVINDISQGTVTADEKSIYRALKRFSESKLISAETRPSDIGPARKYFQLTPLGEELLFQFINRNILVFDSEPVKNKITAFLKSQEQNGGTNDGFKD